MPRGYQDPDCTVFVSNIEARVTEEHLWELFLQAGPLRNVHIPTDKASGKNKTFAFITYRDECSVLYACELLNSLRLFKKPMYCKPTKDGKQSQELASPQTSSNSMPLDVVINDTMNTPQSLNRGDTNRRGQDQGHNDYSGRGRNHFSPQGREMVDHSPRYSEEYNGDYNNGRTSPWEERNNQRGFQRQSYEQNDRSRTPHDRRDYSNRRDSPRFQGNNQSPVFMQAVDQAINQLHRSTSHESPRHNAQYGPMRHDPIPRHRLNRRSRTQPY